MKMKRHSAAEIFPLLASFDRGTLTKADFCKQTKLKESSFSYWLKKYRQSDGVDVSRSVPRKDRSAFVRIEAGHQRLLDYQMEIVLRDGSQIRFTTLVPVEYIQSILTSQ